MTSRPVQIPHRPSRLSDLLTRVALSLGFGLVLLAAAPPAHAQSADLSVVLTDAADPVALGATVSYGIAVRNNGPNDASILTMTQTLDGATAFVSVDGGSWSCGHSGEATGGTVTCTLAVLTASTDADPITVEVTAPTSAATLSSTASIASAIPADPDATNNSSTQGTAVVFTADLSVALSDAADPVALGATVSYGIAVRNDGPDDASTLAMTLTLDAASTFASADGGSWSCSHSGEATGGTVTCTLAALTASTDADPITVEVTAPTSAATLSSTASIASDTADPDATNNSSTQDTGVIVAADLAITKVATPDPVDAGATLTYTLSVENLGPSDAANLQVVDDLPPSATYLAAAGTDWTCQHNSGQDQVTCTRTSLASGATAPDITVTVTAPCGVTSLDNTASVSSDTTDLNDTNDSATITSAVTPVADLSLVLSDSPDPVYARETLSYTLAVSNSGPCSAADVEVVQTLPADAVFASASGSGWTCGHSGEATGGTVTCTLASLAASTDAVAITVAVDAPAQPGDVTSTATVSATTADRDDTDDSDSETTGVTAKADLAVTVSDGVTSAVPGQTRLTYTLTATNNGPSHVTGASFNDDLPTALLSPVWTCRITTGTGSCEELGGAGDIATTLDLESGAVATFTVKAWVAANATGTLTNTAAISSTVYDAVTDNNSATDNNTVLSPSVALTVSKSNGLDGVGLGQSFTYDIRVANAGPSDSATVSLTDTYPDQLEAHLDNCEGSVPCWTCVPSGPLTFRDREVKGGAVNGLEGASAVAVSPDGAHVYTTGAADDGVGTFARAADGSLSFVEFDSGLEGAAGVVVSPDGATVYVAAAGADTVSAFTRNPSTGALTLLDTETDNLDSVDGLDGATAVVVSPDGAHVYVAGAAESKVAAFSRAADGSLSFLHAVATSLGGASALAFGPDGEHLYVAAQTADRVVALARVTDPESADFGRLSSVGAYPSTGLDGARGVAVSPDGAHVYAAAAGATSVVVAFSRAGDGSLTELARYGDSVAGAYGVTVTPEGTQVVVAARAGNAVSVYTRDPASGTLTFVGTTNDTAVDGLAGARAVAASPNGSHLYAVGETDNAVVAFDLSGGGSCPKSGDGDLALSGLVVPAGGALDVAVHARVKGDASGTEVCNTATVPGASPESSQDCDPIVLVTDVVMVKDDGMTTAVPGTSHSYTLTVTNNGSLAVSGATVTDAFPIWNGTSVTAGFATGSVTWQCVPSVGACCASGTSTCGSVQTPYTGSGNISQLVDLAAGASLTFTATGTLDPRATGTLSNQAQVTVPSSIVDPDPTNNVDSDTTTMEPRADLSILKQHGVPTATTVSYTITVSNAGPSATVGATVQDTFPSGVSGVAWTCSPSSGASCTASGSGDLADTVSVPAGGTVTYSATATIVTPPPNPVLVNTATVTGGNAVDPSTGNNSSTDRLTLAATADLLISKTDGRVEAVRGEPLTYVISVANAGPDNVVGATVTDLFSDDLADVAWTCSAVPPIPGELTPLETLGLPGASATVVSPDGAHVYAAGSESASEGRLVAYSRDTDPTSHLYGKLGFIEAFDGDDTIKLGGVSALALSPDGSHLYVAASGDDAVLVFDREQLPGSADYGKLTFVAALVDGSGGVNGLAGARALAVSPDGLHLYVAGANDNALAVFERNTTTGALTFVTAVVDGSGGVNGLAGASGVTLSSDGQFLYATGATDDAVTVFSRDPSTGLLTLIAAAADGIGGVEGLNGASSLVLSPDGLQLYAAGADDDAIAAFARDPAAGTLTFALSYAAGIDGLDGVQAIAISSDGQHLLAAGSLADKLVVFRRNTSTGLLTFQEVLTDNTPAVGTIPAVDGLDGVRAIAISPDPDGSGPSGGGHVYTAAVFDGAVAVFARRQPDPGFAFIEVERDGVNDVGDSGGTVDGLYGARAAAVAPDGRHLYAAGFGDNAIAVFSRDAAQGTTEATRSLHLSFVEAKKDGVGGVDGLAGATAVVVSPDNRHVYAAGQNDNAVTAFTRNQTTGALTFLEVRKDGIGGVDGLGGVNGLALSPDGASLYAAGLYDSAVAVFRRETDGHLTYLEHLVNGVDGVEGLAGVTSLATSPDGSHVYAASRVADALVVFRRALDGRLTFQQALYDGVGADGLDQAQSVKVSPDGAHVYVAAGADDSVAVFRRDTDNTSGTFGSLVLLAVYRNGVGGIAGLDGARSVAVSPDGANVYAAGENENALVIFARVTNDTSTEYGALSPVEVRSDGVDGVDGLRQAWGLAVSPDSRHVYVAGLADSAVAAFVRRSGSSCSASGTGDIEDVVDLGFGGSVSYTVTATVRPGATGDPVHGTLINTATVLPPAGVTDSLLTNNVATDIDTLRRRADLSITKSDGRSSVNAGDAVTYTLSVTNAGPSNEIGALVVDTFSSELLAPTWSCLAIGSGTLDQIDLEVNDVDGVTGLSGASAVALSPDPDGAAGPLPGNTHLYVTGLDSGRVAVFERDGSSGTLTFVQSVTDGVGALAGASDLALNPDPDGSAGPLLGATHLYATGQLGDAVAVFARSSVDGTLTLLQVLRDGQVPAGGSLPVDGLDQAVAVTVSGDGTSVYAAGGNDDAVAIFSRNPASGLLAFVGVVRDGVGGIDGIDGASDLALSPDDAFLYVTGFNDGAVAVFARDAVDGSLSFVERKGSASTAGLAGASAVTLDPTGHHVYVAGALDDAVVAFARDPATGRLTPIQVISNGTAGVLGLDGPVALAASPAGGFLYVASQATDTIAILRRDTTTGRLTFVERLRDGERADGLDGVADLVLSSDGQHLYSAALAADAVAAFMRPGDSTCPASGAGNISQLIDIAAGGRLVFTVDATLAAGAEGVACPAPLDSGRSCLVNQASVAANATDLGDPDPSDNISTDGDYLGRRADLAITKDDGLAEWDGLLGAVDLAVSPGDGDHVYVAAPDDDAIGVFERTTTGATGLGRLHFLAVVRDGVDGVDGLTGITGLVLSSGGQHLYAVSPGDNAVAVFERDPATGLLSQSQVVQHGLAGVTGMLGASSLALSPDGAHLYVTGRDSDAVVVLARDNDPGSSQFGLLTFVNAVTSASGAQGLTGPSSVKVTHDGRHVIVASPLGDTITVFSRDADGGSGTFGRLTYLEHHVEAVGGVEGLAGVAALALTSDGGQLYTASPDASAVARFSRDDDPSSPDFGRLTFAAVVRDGQGGFDGLAGARGLLLTPGDDRLYVAGAAEDAIAILGRDPADGALSLVSVVRDGDLQGGATSVVVQGLHGPAAFASDPAGEHLYVAATGSNAVTGFERDATDGTLTYLETFFDGGGGAPPGSEVTYVIVVTNNGPSDVRGAVVRDTLPTVFENITWECSPEGSGATCEQITGTGDLDETIDIPVGTRVIFAARGTLRPGVTGTLSNTATVSEPPGVVDPDQSNNSATDDNTVLAAVANLSITKDDGLAVAAPGQLVTYQIAVTNLGPSHVASATVEDLLPEALSDAQWTCSATPPPGLLEFIDSEQNGVSGVTGLTGAADVAVTSDGRSVYAVGAGDGAVVVFGRNSRNGSLDYVASSFDGVGGVDGLAGATAVALSPGDDHVYVAGALDDAVAVFARDAGTGELTFLELERDGIGGVNGLGGVRDLVVSPDGAHLYAAGGADNAVAIFTRSAGGALTFSAVRVNGSGGVSGIGGASALAMSPAGDHLYVTGETSNAVAVFERNAATGALTFLEVLRDGVSPVAAGALVGPVDVTVSRDGRWLWVASTTSGTVASFARSTTSGALTYVDHVDQAGASGLAVEPEGGELDVAARSLGTVSVWHIEVDGRLSPLASYDNTTATFSGLAGAHRLAFSADGNHLYVAASADQAVTSLRRQPGSVCTPTGHGHLVDDVELSTGGSLLYTLTARVSPAAAGVLGNTASVEPAATVLDPDLANNSATDTDALGGVADLAIAKTDGRDTTVAGTANSYTLTVTNLGPSDVLGATVSDPFPLYPADSAGLTAGSLSWTCVAPRSLVLADVVRDGEPGVAGLDGATTVVASPDVDGPGGAPGGEHVYVAAALGDAVAAFTRDPAGGALTAIGTLTDGADGCDGLGGATGLAVSPDGRHLYVAATDDDAVSVLERDPASGALTCIQTLFDGGSIDGLAGASAVTVSPDGSHVYAVGKDADAVVVFARDPELGELTFVERKRDGLGDVPLLALDGAHDVLVVPDGRSLYVASQNADAVATFSRDPESGTLAFVGVVRNLDLQGGSTVHGLDLVRSLATSPGGDLLYAASLGNDALVVFTRDPLTGALTYLETHLDGVGGVDGLDGANDVTTSPDGAYVYVAGLNDHAVATFKRDWLTSRLVSLGAERDGIAGADGLGGATGLAVTADGAHLLVAASLEDSLATFDRQAEGRCTEGGSADLLVDTVDLAAGASLTLVVSGQVHPSAQGTLQNVAAVAPPSAIADPDPSNNAASDVTTVEVVTDVAVAKTDGVQTAVAGLPLTYTVTVLNHGPSDAYGLSLVDVLPAPLLGPTWSCRLVSGTGDDMGPCGDGAGSLAESLDLPATWGAVYTVTGTLDPGALGTLTNTASATIAAGSDPDTANNAASDVDAVVQIADLVIGKSNGLTSVVPGTAVTYTVTVSNVGPSHALQARVQDTVPPQLLAPVGWTCTPSGGATCTAGGTGSLNQVVSLPSGSSVTYAISGTVNPAALGTIANTASAQTLGGVSDPDLANNVAADSDPLTPIADLALATVDNPDPVVTGYPLSYTLTATNLGPSNAATVLVADSLPSGVTLAGTVGCTEDGSGGGGVPQCTLGPIAAGASAQYQIEVVVDEGTLGSLVNSAVAASSTSDPDLANNTSTVTTTSVPWADLALAKADSADPAVAGTELVYTLTVSNPSPYEATGVTVSESLPSGVTATGTSGCAEDPGGVPVCTLGTIASGQSKQYTLTVLVDSATLGTLVNQATATATTFDPTTADNSAVETTEVTAVADLWASKDNGVGWLELGQHLTYTLAIGNDGPSDVPSASVSDDMPASLIDTEWTCVATGDAFCSPAGTGNLLLDSVELPAGTWVTYTVTTTLDRTTPLPATVVNTVEVAADGGETDPNPGDNAATDSDPVEDTRIFVDGFESGDLGAWSAVVPPVEVVP